MHCMSYYVLMKDRSKNRCQKWPHGMMGCCVKICLLKWPPDNTFPKVYCTKNIQNNQQLVSCTQWYFLVLSEILLSYFITHSIFSFYMMTYLVSEWAWWIIHLIDYGSQEQFLISLWIFSSDNPWHWKGDIFYNTIHNFPLIEVQVLVRGINDPWP